MKFKRARLVIGLGGFVPIFESGWKQPQINVYFFNILVDFLNVKLLDETFEHLIYMENAPNLMAIYRIIWNQLFSDRSHRCQDNLRYGLQFYPDRDRCDNTETISADIVVIVAMVNIPVRTMSSFDPGHVDHFYFIL